MIENNGWIRAHQAKRKLDDNGFKDPEVALLKWAKSGSLSVQAQKGAFDGGGIEEFPVNKGEGRTSWPYVPSDFWLWVEDNGKLNLEADFAAATICYDPEIGDFSDREHIQLYGLKFSSPDLDELIGSNSIERLNTASARVTNAGRKPNTQKWSEFGAALAYVTNLEGPEVLSSREKLYNAVATILTEKGYEPFDEKTVRSMLDIFRFSYEQESFKEAS